MSRVIEIRFNFEMAAGIAPGNVTVVTPVNYMRVRNRTRAYNANAEEQRILWIVRPDDYIVTYTNPRAYMSVIREQNSLLGISYSKRNAVMLSQISSQTIDCFIIKECFRLWQDCKDDPNVLQRGLFISLDKCSKHLPLKYPYVIDDLDDDTESPTLSNPSYHPTQNTRPSISPYRTTKPTSSPSRTNRPSSSPSKRSRPTSSPFRTTTPSSSPIQTDQPSFTPIQTTQPSLIPTMQTPSRSPLYLNNEPQNGNQYPINQVSADYFYWFFLLAPFVVGMIVIFVVYKKKA